MLLNDFSLWKRHTLIQACVFALVAQSMTPAFGATQGKSANTQTPIKHVVVIIGENRTFDHIFATYTPKKGERVSNLLSKRIINEDGTPGPNFFLATQWSASDTQDDKYQISPAEKTLYSNLSPPLAGGPTDAPFSTIDAAKLVENGLPDDYYQFLTTGGTGLKAGTPDSRILDVNNLLPGPFQLTSASFPYDAYAASPVHRFYQMWQQFDCNALYTTRRNPSGCLADLFPWVEVTIGAGSNGNPQPSPFDLTTTREGGTSMGFYNVLQGDAPT
jgi:phospholipase C